MPPATEPSDTTLPALFQQAPTALCLLDDGLRFLVVNDRLALTSGLSTAAHAGLPIAQVLPELACVIAPALDRVLASGTPIEALEAAWTREGEARVWLCNIAPLCNGAGIVEQIACAFTDITTRARVERYERMLSDETDHRARNTLSIARGLVRLSAVNAGDDVPALVEAIEGRILAMSRVHAVLARERWVGADLREIVAQELAPYPGRTEMGGPALRLTAAASQPLTLVLHELVSNAARFGALSCETGQLDVHWEVRDGRVLLRWRETGGPSIAAVPAHQGFGARLIDANLRMHLAGSIARAWEVEGLRCVIQIGAEAIAGRFAAAASAEPGPLTGRRVLLVDDDVASAAPSIGALMAAGCEVLGPATRLSDALLMIETAGALDAVVLAPTLQGCSAQPLAHLLRRRAIAVLHLSPLMMSARDRETATILLQPIPPQALCDALIAVLAAHGAVEAVPLRA